MIIFDLDGTLWDTTMNTYKAANIVANLYDEVKDISLDTIKSGMGLSTEENAKNYMPYLNEDKAVYYLNEIIKKNIETMDEDGAILYDGVYDTIINLSKKYKLGIITNNKDEYVDTFFKISGLKNYFVDYMGAATYGITKGETIKKMIDRNNEPNSFYVGDIEKDMVATEEAGINFIHARYGFEPKLDSQYYIDDIRNLELLLDNLISFLSEIHE